MVSRQLEKPRAGFFEKRKLAHKNRIERSLTDKLQIYAMVYIPFLLFVTFVVYPLLWILRYAFYDYSPVESTFIGLENFKILLQDKTWWKAVYNTFYLTIGGMVVGMPLSLVLAVLLNTKFKGNTAAKVILYTPCLISSAIVGIIFSIMLEPNDGIINELLLAFGLIDEPFYILDNPTIAKWTLIIVGVWQSAGYNMTLFLSGLQKIPNELYEAASVSGANALQKFWYITIPQLGSMLKLILMLSLVNGLKTFDLVSVLTGGKPDHGTTTIVTYIYNYFFETEGYLAQQGYAAAASVVASIIILVVTLIYFYLSRNLKED